MAIVILILLGLTIYHYLVESTIIPSIREELRFRLFAQRDALRRLKLVHGDDVNNVLFMDMQHGLNTMVNIVDHVTLSFILRANEEIKGNEKLLAKIAERDRLLNESRVEGLREIHKKVTNYVFTASIVNSLGWTPYTFPFSLMLVFVLIIFGAFQRAKAWFRRKVSALIYAPEKDIDELVAHYVPVRNSKPVLQDC